MSSNDHPEPGVQNPKDDQTSGAATSPQDSQPQPPVTEPSSPPATSEPANESVASAAPSTQAQTQPGDAAAANHPATGGENTPVTAATSTTTPPHDNSSAVAQPQNNEPTPMDTAEPKPSAEVSSDPSEDALGKEAEEDSGPSLDITLLLTTGSRHPFTIDGKYLRKRSVNVENYDPFAMSVYTLKELIWREWRSGESTSWQEQLGTWQAWFTDVVGLCRLGNTPFVPEFHSSDLVWETVGRQVPSVWYVSSCADTTAGALI